MRLLTNAGLGMSSEHPNQLGAPAFINIQDPTARFQARGTFGVAGSVKIYLGHSFNAPRSSWALLATITDATPVAITNLTNGYIVAQIEAGDGTTNLTVDMLLVG